VRADAGGTESGEAGAIQPRFFVGNMGVNTEDTAVEFVTKRIRLLTAN
jgi:hypothetical protein